MKKSSSQFFGNKNKSNNNNYNKQDKIHNLSTKNISHNNINNPNKYSRKTSGSKLNYNIRSINFNNNYSKGLNSSNSIYKNNIKYIHCGIAVKVNVLCSYLTVVSKLLNETCRSYEASLAV